MGDIQYFRRHRENVVAAAGLPCQDRIDIRCGFILGLLLNGNYIQYELETMGRRIHFMVNTENERDIFWTDFSEYVKNIRYNNPFNTFISEYDDHYRENFKENQFMMVVDALETFLNTSVEWKGKVVIGVIEED